jgi:hypothetical protein
MYEGKVLSALARLVASVTPPKHTHTLTHTHTHTHTQMYEGQVLSAIARFASLNVSNFDAQAHFLKSLCPVYLI